MKYEQFIQPIIIQGLSLEVINKGKMPFLLPQPHTFLFALVTHEAWAMKSS